MHHHNGLISDPGTDLQSKALIALTFEHVRAFTICAYHLSNILIVSLCRRVAMVGVVVDPACGGILSQ